MTQKTAAEQQKVGRFHVNFDPENNRNYRVSIDLRPKQNYYCISADAMHFIGILLFVECDTIGKKKMMKQLNRTEEDEEEVRIAVFKRFVLLLLKKIR